MPTAQLTTDFIKTSFGNAIEWYDFSLYAFFALEISHSFFPNYSAFLALLITFLTFSVSFIARPIGSLIFGYLGDKIGKHYSVNLAIWCMAVPTVFIGVLPSYQRIGIFAPILLIGLRFIQGISLGGQFSGLITIAVDNPSRTRQLHIGIILAVSMFGSLLASLSGLISYHLFIHSSASLVWRVPFVFSGLLFYIYLKLRPKIKKRPAASNYSIRHIFEQQPQELFYMTMISAVMSSIYYLLFSYSVTFMHVHLGINDSDSLLAINIFLLIALVCFLLYGTLANEFTDRVHLVKRFTLLQSGLIWILSFNSNFTWVVLSFSLLTICYCGISTYMTAMFAEIFQKEYRMTACSLCYSGGAALGGFSPFLAEIVCRHAATGFYLLLISFTFILYLLLKKISNTQGYQDFILNH